MRELIRDATVVRRERCEWNGEMDKRMGGVAWQDERCEGRECVREWEQRALSVSCADPTFAWGVC